MAWVLLNFVSRYGAPKILHVDNGREFISLAYDEKYQGPRQVEFSEEESEKIVTEFQKLLPGTKMVHGKARHSQSQGFIENRNKVAINFLTKWCLQNNTAFYWMGIPSMRFHINGRINRGNKMSPFEYLYGVKPTAGISSLPLDRKLINSLVTEEDLNRALDIPSDEMIEMYLQPASKVAVIPVVHLHEEDSEWKLGYCTSELAASTAVNKKKTDGRGEKETVAEASDNVDDTEDADDTAEVDDTKASDNVDDTEDADDDDDTDEVDDTNYAGTTDTDDACEKSHLQRKLLRNLLERQLRRKLLRDVLERQLQRKILRNLV
jgi:hypothetical protein